MATSFVIGNAPTMIGTFRDKDGELADPTEVHFFLKLPDDAETRIEYVYGIDSQLVKESTGVYSVFYKPVDVGAHEWRFEGDGACDAANEDEFTVTASRVLPE